MNKKRLFGIIGAIILIVGVYPFHFAITLPAIIDIVLLVSAILALVFAITKKYRSLWPPAIISAVIVGYKVIMALLSGASLASFLGLSWIALVLGAILLVISATAKK
jgi:hypothetical protein